MIRYIFYILFCSVGLYNLQAQDKAFVSNIAVGPEVQLYPTGILFGMTFYKELNEYNYLGIRAGYNFVRHGSAGLHEDERGGGWGGTIGYHRQINIGNSHWLVGARCDLWRNKIDWTNRVGEPDEVTGISRITVIQPTVQLAYPFRVTDQFFLPSISFGSEINIRTEGEEVGEGLILLIGLSYILD